MGFSFIPIILTSMVLKIFSFYSDFLLNITYLQGWSISVEYRALISHATIPSLIPTPYGSLSPIRSDP